MGAKVSIKSEDDQLENDEYKSDRNIHFRKCSGVLKDLCAYQPEKADATIRLPHSCYMILIGRLKNQDDMNIIRAMNESVGITSNRENDLNQIEYTIMQSEYIEAIFEYITLQHTTQQIQQSRRTHLVYEDNFNQSLFDIVQMNSSYDKLKAVCRKYLQSEDVDEAMHTHQCRVNKTYSYFSDKGLSDNESKALAFSLSFYTGTRSEACNRSASLIAHRAHSQVVEQRTEEEINEAAIIVYYLVKALSYIPFYWGHVTRACQLTDEELLIYRPGSLITWIQFSSSKKGKQVVNSKMFQNRNVLFKIYSLTGRPIQQFSNYEEEDEVLFLPHSTFLIFNRKTFPKQKKHVIYMRQVELGLCEWSVLWVDDKIFDENWENKQHMEYAAIKALDINVHFIPKSDTDTALSFLRSPFGQRLKNEKTFRIVTDMNRDNERCPHNAGARFIMALRQLGFNNQCLVFTGNQQQAQQHLRTLLNSHQQQNLQVSQQTNDLRRFINFDREATRTTNIQVSMFNNINTNIHLLRRNLNKQFSFQNRNNCVLLTTGSFNPIHRLHFQNLLFVKEYLEKQSFRVLGGYLSPTHDDYVRNKLGDRHWISAKDRCDLCEQALEYEDKNNSLSSWISICRGESQWHDGFIDFTNVTEYFRDFVNNYLVEERNLVEYPIDIVYVCGLDHFNKCRQIEMMTMKMNIKCAVIYRVGYDEQRIDCQSSSNIIYIPLNQQRHQLQSISSTQIRQYFQNDTNTCANDIDKCLYPNVRDYMINKYRRR